jgi:hypothetical protein
MVQSGAYGATERGIDGAGGSIGVTDRGIDGAGWSILSKYHR